MDEWGASLTEGKPLEIEARLRRADREYRWLLIRAVPLRDETGKIVKWYGTSADIEDQKRAEETLRKSQADLAHVTRVTTMGELAASIAHEVNQPLSAIMNSGQRLPSLAGERRDLTSTRLATPPGTSSATGTARESHHRIRALLRKTERRRRTGHQPNLRVVTLTRE